MQQIKFFPKQMTFAFGEVKIYWNNFFYSACTRIVKQNVFTAFCGQIAENERECG